MKSKKKKKKTETVQTNSEQSFDEGNMQKVDNSVNIAQEDKTFQGNTECTRDCNSGM